MPSVTMPFCHNPVCLQYAVAGIRRHSAAAHRVIVHDDGSGNPLARGRGMPPAEPGGGTTLRWAQRHGDRRWRCRG